MFRSKYIYTVFLENIFFSGYEKIGHVHVFVVVVVVLFCFKKENVYVVHGNLRKFSIYIVI